MALRSPRSLSKQSFAPPPSSMAYRNIAFTFLGLTILVAIAVAWVSSVHARITIKTKRDVASVETMIDVAKSPEQGQLQGRVVQGVFEKIQEFSVKDQPDSSPTVGVVQGTVKIVNNYSRPQTLVQKTRLLTADGRLYRIDKTITVSSKESLIVTAHSDESGERYVLPSGVHLTIPGLWVDLQKWIYAESVSGFSGTPGAPVKIVQSSDVTEAQASLEQAVFEQAQKTLKAEAGVGDDWKAVYVKKVVETKNNVSAGQTSDRFLASIKLDVTGVYYPTKDMDVLIRQKLKDKLPSGRELVEYNPAFAVFTIENMDSKLEKARINVSAQAAFRLTDQSPQLSKDAVLGLADSEAQKKLMSIEGVESVDLKLRPTWIHTLPTSKDKIDLIVE